MKSDFKDFSISNDTYMSKHMLVEGLAGIKKIAWSGMDIATAFRVLQFSPSWNADIMRGKMLLELDESLTAPLKLIRNNIYRSVLKINGPSIRKVIEQKSGSATATITIADTPADPAIRNKYLSQYFGLLMKFIGQADGTLRKAVQRDDDKIKIAGDTDDQTKRAFAVVDYFNSKKIEERPRLNSDDGVKALESFNQSKFEASSTGGSSSESAAKLMCEGYFGDCLFLFSVAEHLKTIKDKVVSSVAMIPDLKTPFEKYTRTNFKYLKTIVQPVVEAVVKDFGPGKFNWKDVLGRPSIDIVDNNANICSYYYNKVQKKFDEISEFDGEVSEESRWFLSIANNMLQSSGKNQKNIEWLTQQLKTQISADKRAEYEKQLTNLKSQPNADTPNKLIQFFKTHNIGFLIRKYGINVQQSINNFERKKKNSKEEGVDFDEAKEKQKILKNIMQFKTIGDLMTALDSTSQYKSMLNADVNYGNNLARRRMKLFKDLKQRGGEYFTSKNWVVGITKTQYQSNIWGRNKPKVRPGTNEIDETINRNDVEPNLPNLTPEQIQRRDGSGQWIQDGNRFDKWPTETGWCTSPGLYNKQKPGGQSSWNNTRVSYSFNGYAPRSGGVLIQIMDARDGILYQFGGGSFLDEHDGLSGIIAEASKRGLSGLKGVLSIYPELLSLFTEAQLFKYVGASYKPSNNNESLIDQAQKNNRLTPNGGLLIEQKSDLDTYRDIFGYITELIPINNKCASGLFSFRTFNSLPPINCCRITCASSMFMGLTLDIEDPVGIVLRNTDHVLNMQNMFHDARINVISGLDTSSATCIDSMLQNCRCHHYRPLQLTNCNLSLKSCLSMNNAFSKCALQSIDIHDIENVRSAKNAFTDCDMLKRVPDIKFSRISSARNLVDDFNGEYEDIFAGCTALFKTQNFKTAIDDIQKYYEGADHASTSAPPVDSRGFLILHTREEAMAYAQEFSKYKGVVIDQHADTFCLFDEIPAPLRIRVLDINGHKNITRLFNKCQIQRLDQIIGTEFVQTASQMFYGTKIRIYPQMSFPRYTDTLNIFCNAPAPEDIPEVSFGIGLKSFGEKYDKQAGLTDNEYRERASGICSMMFAEYAEDWKKKMSPDGMRLADKTYWKIFEDIGANILKSLNKDDKEYIIIDKVSASKLSMILDSKPKGLRLKVNSKELFQNKSFKNPLPPIDMQDLTDASELFKQASIPEFPKLENTQNLRTTSSMFFQARFDSIPQELKIDMSNVINAESMFQTMQINKKPATLVNLTLVTPKLVNSSSMFNSIYVLSSVRILCFNLKMDFNSIETANLMFANMDLTACSNLTPSFPKLINGVEMFHRAKLSTVFANWENYKLPNTVNISSMFSQVRTIIKLPASFSLPPSVQNASNLFEGTNIEFNSRFVKIQTNAATNIDNMFDNGNIITNSPSFEITELNCPNVLTANELLRRQPCKRIIRINMPRVTSINSMFTYCDSLLGILMPNINSQCSHTNILTKTPLETLYGRDGELLFARQAIQR